MDIIKKIANKNNFIIKNKCIQCSKAAFEFKDLISWKEYQISGLCQYCQDAIFTEEFLLN